MFDGRVSLGCFVYVQVTPGTTQRALWKLSITGEYCDVVIKPGQELSPVTNVLVAIVNPPRKKRALMSTRSYWDFRARISDVVPNRAMLAPNGNYLRLFEISFQFSFDSVRTK